MPRGRIVFVFPGQGSHTRGLTGRTFGSAGAYEDFDTIARAVQDELGVDIGAVLTDPAADDPEQLRTSSPAVLQVLLFANAVRSARTAQAFGIRADTFVGHSFGEIAALTAAGWFSLADGTRVVCRRVRALARLDGDPGAMLALSVPADRARALLGAVGSGTLAVAGTNTDSQTVVSGPTADIATVTAVAAAVGVRATALASPYAFHNPILAGVATEFADSLRDIRWSPAATPVFSPVLGRTYVPDDDLAALLARHLVEPFDFAAAVRSCFDGGATTFVECGGRAVLTALVGRVLRNEQGWLALATDTSVPSGRDVVQLSREIAALGGDLQPLSAALHESVAPGSDPAVFDRFWSVVGPELIQQVGRSFVDFQTDGRGGPSTASPQVPVSVAAVTVAPVTDVPVPTASTGSVVTLAPVATRSREQVTAALAALYGEALEYPVEVFTPEVGLESDLGVDSVKQTDLLGRVAAAFALPLRPEGFTVADFPTFGDVVDLVLTADATTATGTTATATSAGAATGVPVFAGSDADAPVGTATGTTPRSREQVTAALAALYGEALEYPVEVFTPEVGLESDLGVDSVKQTDLLGRVAAAFALPLRPEGFTVADFPTFGDVVDLVLTADATTATGTTATGTTATGQSSDLLGAGAR